MRQTMSTALIVLISFFMLLPPQDAEIRGVASDVSGAVIPAATVSLSGANVQRTTQTQADGTFSFRALATGDYTLKSNYLGFEAFEDHVSAISGLKLLMAIRLRPQVITQALTVTEDRGTELSLDSDQNAGSRVVKNS